MTDPSPIVTSPVVVRLFPEKLSSDQAPAFFRQMQELLNSVQPRIVLNFAEVRELGAAGVQVLLQCLEEAMKRNGDVKLAAVSSAPSVVLEGMGVDHLFEIFESADDAVLSFQYLADCQPDPVPAPGYTNPLPATPVVGGLAAD